MAKLVDILKNEPDLSAFFTNYFNITIIKKNWDSIVGENLKKDLKFGGLKGDTLIIDAYNPAWVVEVSRYQDLIITNVNNLLVKYKIRKVKVTFIDKKAIANKSFSSVIPSSKENNLLASIQKEIQRKINTGYKLCSQCQKAYTLEKKCIYCRNNKTRS